MIVAESTMINVQCHGTRVRRLDVGRWPCRRTFHNMGAMMTTSSNGSSISRIPIPRDGELEQREVRNDQTTNSTPFRNALKYCRTLKRQWLALVLLLACVEASHLVVPPASTTTEESSPQAFGRSLNARELECRFRRLCRRPVLQCTLQLQSRGCSTTGQGRFATGTIWRATTRNGMNDATALVLMAYGSRFGLDVDGCRDNPCQNNEKRVDRTTDSIPFRTTTFLS
jgi:hypothetical protein